MKDLRKREILYLVHAICLDSDGQPFAHAWVEEGPYVWFSGKVKGEFGYCQVYRDEYYAYMQVQDTTKYDIGEAARENQRTNNYGPWKRKYYVLCKNYLPGMKTPDYLRDEE